MGSAMAVGLLPAPSSSRRRRGISPVHNFNLASSALPVIFPLLSFFIASFVLPALLDYLADVDALETRLQALERSSKVSYQRWDDISAAATEAIQRAQRELKSAEDIKKRLDVIEKSGGANRTRWATQLGSVRRRLIRLGATMKSVVSQLETWQHRVKVLARDQSRLGEAKALAGEIIKLQRRVAEVNTTRYASQEAIKKLRNRDINMQGELKTLNTQVLALKEPDTSEESSRWINVAPAFEGEAYQDIHLAKAEATWYASPQPSSCSPRAIAASLDRLSIETLRFGIISEGQDNFPQLALHHSTAPGNAWCFKGSQANLTVRLPRAVMVEAVALTHPFITYTTSASQEHPSHLLTAAPLHCAVELGNSYSHRFTYEAEDQHRHGTRQIFRLKPTKKVNTLTLAILSQHRTRPWTCLYRFEVLARTSPKRKV